MQYYLEIYYLILTKEHSPFIYFYLTLEGLKKLITNCLQNSCCAKGQKKLDQMFFIIK